MFKALSSVRITVVCLFLLFVLTFWGTIAQVEQGLYVAQERYFASFFFLAGGWLPFPGAQLVLWVLFVNLLCSLGLHFNKHQEWTYIGSKITHVGLLLYFVAAFFIFHLSQESYIHLGEDEFTNVSASYTDWEVAFWQSSPSAGHSRQITAVDAKNFKPGTQVIFHYPDFILIVGKYFPNAGVTDEGIVPKALDKEREKNMAAGAFDLTFSGQHHPMVLSGTQGPAAVDINGKTYYFVLRHKRYPLPFILQLDHFKAEFHPGTDVAKSFESLVTISTGSLQRQVRIYMNNPLRYKDYTLYQASYDTDSMGRQYSTLAVVKNSVRILPYIACFMVFFGLALHFLIQALVAKSKL